jgi:hypothetical protein
MTKKAKKNNNKPAKIKAKAYNKMSRIEKYEHIMQLSTEDIWTYMIKRLEILPDEELITDVSEAQERVIDDVEAVESEWILDDYTRRAVSLIQWTDDDER